MNDLKKMPVAVFAGVLLVSIAGCAGGTTTTAPTGGTTTTDTSSSGAGTDSGATSNDSGSTAADTASTSSSADAGSVAVDAGQPAPDIQVATDTGKTSGGSKGGWGPEHCATKGPPLGYKLGNRLADVPVQDCDTGAVRSIKEVCGAQKTWLFVAHTHCPTCQMTASYTAKLAKELASDGVAVVHVVHVDDHQTCPGWRKQYGLEGIGNLKVYLDKTGAAWSKIKTAPYTAAHAIMGKDQIISYKGHGLSAAVVKKKLALAL